MSLDKVRATVLEAARSKADGILAEAGDGARRIADEAGAASDRAGAEALRDARNRVERETARELERIRHDNRLRILEAKNKAIDEVFAKVRDAIAALSDDDYVAMVGKWLASLPADVGGVLRVNPKDEARFAARAADLNRGRSGPGRFTAVRADPEVASGAVVDGPGYAVDCTVDRRLGELRETAAGDLARTLFGS